MVINIARATTLLGIALMSTCLFPFTVSGDDISDWLKMLPIKPRTYQCVQTSAAPTIDGKLDDETWSSIEWTDAFIDIEGESRPRPRLTTRAAMSWDNDCFYVAAKLLDPHVWGTLTKHDSVIFHDNDFEVFIDPNGDNHEYFEFEMNALNTGWDLFLARPYKDGVKADNSWEIPGLRTAVSVDGSLNDASDTDQGWSLEIAIPWSALQRQARTRVPPNANDTWRVNFSRVQWHHKIVDGKYQKKDGIREDNWVWSPQGIIDMHRPERWGVVQFVSDKAVHDNPVTQFEVFDSLMSVYHFQRAFRRAHNRYAKDIQELSSHPTIAKLQGTVMLQATENGFTATRVADMDGNRVHWHVRQDSKLWSSDSHSAVSNAITAILMNQQVAWNTGDIDAFMQPYWQSEWLTFSSGGATTRGWTKTMERYKRRYPTPKEMGTLNFSNLEIQVIGKGVALVLGQWALQRDEPIGGNFSLILRLMDSRWVIIHDHTSVLQEP